MAQAQAGSNFLALPDDLRGIVLALIPHDSLTAAALVCRAFHAVISGPQFPALRQRFGGFAAPGPLIVAVTSGKIWRELLMSNSFSLSVSWRLFLTRAGSWSSYRTAQLSSEPRSAPGPATKSPREPFPTTGLTTCTPRPSARDMQVSLSRYRLGFTL